MAPNSLTINGTNPFAASFTNQAGTSIHSTCESENLNKGDISLHKMNRLHKQELFRRLNQKHFDSLSNREREVLTKIVLGIKVNSIADELFISSHTVQQHKKNIKRKLHTSSSQDLMMYALAFDLI